MNHSMWNRGTQSTLQNTNVNRIAPSTIAQILSGCNFVAGKVLEILSLQDQTTRILTLHFHQHPDHCEAAAAALCPLPHFLLLHHQDGHTLHCCLVHASTE